MGVMTAAMTKAARMAYLRYEVSRLTLTMPIFDKKKIVLVS